MRGASPRNGASDLKARFASTFARRWIKPCSPIPYRMKASQFQPAPANSFSRCRFDTNPRPVPARFRGHRSAARTFAGCTVCEASRRSRESCRFGASLKTRSMSAWTSALSRLARSTVDPRLGWTSSGRTQVRREIGMRRNRPRSEIVPRARRSRRRAGPRSSSRYPKTSTNCRLIGPTGAKSSST